MARKRKNKPKGKGNSSKSNKSNGGGTSSSPASTPPSQPASPPPPPTPTNASLIEEIDRIGVLIDEAIDSRTEVESKYAIVKEQADAGTVKGDQLYHSVNKLMTRTWDLIITLEKANESLDCIVPVEFDNEDEMTELRSRRKANVKKILAILPELDELRGTIEAHFATLPKPNFEPVKPPPPKASAYDSGSDGGNAGGSNNNAAGWGSGCVIC